MCKRILVLFAVVLFSISAWAEGSGTNRSTLTDVGDVLQLSIPIFAAGLAFYKEDDEGLKQDAEGALYTALATHITKFVVNEKRPNGGDYSFPSGHTSAAMQGAAFLAYRYGWEYGVPATALATVVGYSRVDARYHYTRDVVAGTALAWGVQYMISKMGVSPTKYLLSPFFGDNGEVGVSFATNF